MLWRRDLTLTSSGLLVFIACVSLSACGVSRPPATPPPASVERISQDLPWEFWTAPSSLPRLSTRGSAHLRSSYCPSGCRFDRHSSGDSRFLRVENGEGVLLDETGPGALTRIWVTMGQGVSVPLDPKIRIRIYLDGEARPRLDLPLTALFDGSQSPFVPPLVGNRLTSSGGYFSYVPIAYRDGCRVTLVGAEDARIWFQINHYRLEDATGVETFDGSESLDRLISLMRTPSADPWLDDGALTIAGTVEVSPRERVPFFVAEEPGLVNALWLEAPEASWDHLRLELTFDGLKSVDLPLRDAFAIGRGGELTTRSLLVGLADDGTLYSFFPMPYFDRVEMGLRHTGQPDGKPIEVGYRIRRDRERPAAHSGLFGASVEISDFESAGQDLRLLELEGAGKWVGLFSELVGGGRRIYLEGDERIYLDGSTLPDHHGTGVEDLFNGGFYFDQGPFRQALHGMTYRVAGKQRDTTAAYRLLLADAVSFERSIRAALEAGPIGETPMSVRSVAFYYLRPG